MTKKRKNIAVIINILIIIFELVGALLSFRKNGFKMVMFYTECSNLFAMLSCIFYVIFSFKKSNNNLPVWIKVLKYMSVCGLTLTFLIVLFVLAPMIGPKGYEIMLFHDSMLYHHFLCPLLLIISFLGFEDRYNYTKNQNIYAVIPTFIYAFVIVLLNILRIIEGPYPFLRVYKQPVYLSFIWMVVILESAYLIAYLLRVLKKEEKK